MSKITREAQERCVARTNAQQLAEYRRTEEIDNTIKHMEGLLRERRKRKMTIDFDDRRNALCNSCADIVQPCANKCN